MTSKPRKLPPLEREGLLDLHQGQHPVRTTVRRRMRFVIPRRVRITKAGLKELPGRLDGFGTKRRWL